MDIDLSEEQEMLRKMARDFLADKCPGTLVREMMEDERGYPPELWREIADLGWLGLVFPSDYGGEDFNFLELAILLEEMGRVSFPGPFFSTVVLGGLPILHMGTDEQKKEFLPKLCKGDLLATLALTEADASFDPSAVTLKAIPDNDSFILSGSKLFVPDAHIADLLICVARTSPAGEPDQGITVFLVNGKSPGLERNLLTTVDGSKQCEVIFKEARVSKNAVLGEADAGWEAIERILALAAVAKCAEMLGGAQRVLDMAIQYSKERQQFGRFIGTFQAIQHHCANMATDVDGMRLTTYQAAWMLSESLPCKKEVSMAKAWASDAFKRVTFLGLRVHGGVGFMEDHDVSIFYRKARTDEFSFGDADFHRNIVSHELQIR
jgi:alkylation response protein AidB-like acyl-CoA dehydrogenase